MRQTTIVPQVADFEVTGVGDAPAWTAAEWLPLERLAGKAPYTTRAKLVYSPTGIYALFECVDARVTCTLAEDFAHLFTEDVVEVFLWPDPALPVYFEYELSPKNFELPLLIPNYRGRFVGWRPMVYQGARRCRHATRVDATGWTAEMFIPFALLPASAANPPRAGQTWRANLYRLDYDELPATKWAWQPVPGGNFHDYENFGMIEFA
jgi:hypothetical protein